MLVTIRVRAVNYKQCEREPVRWTIDVCMYKQRKDIEIIKRRTPDRDTAQRTLQCIQCPPRRREVSSPKPSLLRLPLYLSSKPMRHLITQQREKIANPSVL